MRHFLLLLLVLSSGLAASAQTDRHVQHKPYIDLRPMHFGILVGMHVQDVELRQTGPFTLTDDEGQTSDEYILTDADRWNAGISVGVLAEMRLSDHFSLRLTPTMHFGAKHLTFLNMQLPDVNGQPTQVTQDMKNTYVSLPLDLKFAAPRWNNHRPYLMAGLNPMINLTGGDQDMLRLKRMQTMLEVGLGCDFYLPFFKLIPELKFCFGLGNSLDTHHASELRNSSLRPYALSADRATSKMVVLTFYFE